MVKKVFISYSHKQGEWVWNRLVPCLRCGGPEIYIDRERFEAGKAIKGQMDLIQDKVDIHLIVLSLDYLNSEYCIHEMQNAINKDPKFEYGKVIPILRELCPLPNQITQNNPLYVDLQQDKDSRQWDVLLKACEADLGVDASNWLSTRNEIMRNIIDQNESINLKVSGNPKWHEIILHIKEDFCPELGIVDLENGGTTSRSGLVTEILKVTGCQITVIPRKESLIYLSRILEERTITKLAIEHFDLFRLRSYYGTDFFVTLKNLIRGSGKLVLLVQSRQPFKELSPKEVSPLNLKTIELAGK